MRGRLLAAMEQKRHPSWRAFVEGRVSHAGLIAHYEQEWAVFARDFPVLLGRILGMAPPPEVRAMLAETIYEEQTGGLSGAGPHAEMLRRLIVALGGEAREPVALVPEAARYRAVLDEITRGDDWRAAVAVVCIFVEGTAGERSVLAAAEASGGAALSDAAVDAVVASHPLRLHYGIDASALESVRVHARHEPRRRLRAWRALLDHAGPEHDEAVLAAVGRALAAWLSFREAVWAGDRIAPGG